MTAEADADVGDAGQDFALHVVAHGDVEGTAGGDVLGVEGE